MESLLSGQLLFAALVLGGLYALIALGLNLVYGTMRLLNIAHGDLLMIGGYGAFWCFTLTGMSPLLGLPVIAAIT
ncbi:MAG TPA: branched-chain amino acid ABC transporter permease, partial [Rhodospirillaceae bacterium]|nr:branched-chain amino acid ABC transporter permease [Rhodospirillaceae bacterium]